MTEFSKGFHVKRQDKSFWDPTYAGAGWVYGTIAGSWLIDLLPTHQLPFVPSLLIVTLSYWAIYQPQRIYYWLVFLIGLLTDADTGSVFGQNALSFCIVVFCTELINVRLKWLTPVGQALTMLPIFLLLPILKIIESICFGTNLFEWSWFAESLICVLLWPPCCWFLAKHFYPIQP